MSKKYQNKYRIESNRWQNWDYSAPGSYFITICIENREEILGKIENGEMHLSAYGEIVKNEFIQMGNYNERAVLDAWVIMPNHVHCIITLKNWDDIEKIHEFSLHEFSLRTPPPILSPPTENEIKQYRLLRRKMLIPLLEGKFKTLTSKQINLLRNTEGRKTWQPDYYDHVIRDDAEYHRIKQYIINNPAKWHDDTFNNENDGRCNDDGGDYDIGYGDWFVDHNGNDGGGYGNGRTDHNVNDGRGDGDGRTDHNGNDGGGYGDLRTDHNGNDGGGGDGRTDHNENDGGGR